MRKKLLYITSRVFWPTKSGHEVHIYNYCRELYDYLNYDIDVFILEDKQFVEKAKQTKPEFINKVFCGSSISKILQIKNFILNSVIGKNRWPIQCDLYYSNNNKNILSELHRENEYDVIFADMVRVAPYLEAFIEKRSFSVLDMGDILSKRYKRQLEDANGNSALGGAYTDKLPMFLQKIISVKWIKAMILKKESRLMEEAEKYWANQYDKVILVSKLEADELKEILTEDKVFDVRVPVDCGYFCENVEIDTIPNSISFLGDMRTDANIATVRYIIEDILPRCNEVDKVFFIGKCREALKREYSDNDRIVFTGMVHDVRREIKKTSVFLAPMSYGSGVKIKIVEAMAMGMAVITNRIGSEGIPGENGVHWVVSDDSVAIAQSIDKLMKEESLRGIIGTNAQKLIINIFDWKSVEKAFRKAGL